MTRGRTIRIGIITLMSVCGMLAVAGRAIASTVVPMNVATMGDYAAQVIVAEIGMTKPNWAENPRRIETTVELNNIEYLKGGYDGAPIHRTLIVPGGRIGEKQLRICCAPEFETGQRWVLFLLPDYRTFPTVGLGQGAFRIVADDVGAAYVYQHGGLPVAGVNKAKWIEYAASPPAHVHGQVSSASSTLRVIDRSNSATAELMTFEAFRKAIQPVLDASRDHKLTQPAGRHVPVTLRPVPIRATAGETAGANAKPGERTMRRPPEARSARRRASGSGDSNANPAATPAAEAKNKSGATASVPERATGGDR